MDHNLSSSNSSSPLHQKPNATKTSSAAGSSGAGGGDNLSQLSPTSDISSLSTVAEISVEKYQRLASEYAKLRSQFVVLKKGVIEEQSKNAELQEMLKQRDQAARRLQQETESLVFRNKQLTKRISVLQNDLDHNEAGGSQKRSFLFAGDSTKNRTSSNASTTSSIPSVDAELVDEINQELKNKIEENERLRELVTTLENKRSEELQSLERKLKESEIKAEQRIETLNGEIRSLTSLVSKVKSEKAVMEEKLKESLQNMKNTTESMEKLKQENTQLKNRAMVFEKQLMAAKQHARLQQAQSPVNLLQLPSASSPIGNESSAGGGIMNGIPRSGSFSGIVRSSGSFSRGVPRSGSLSINHSGSPTLANLLSTQSQSSKDLSQLNGGANQQTSPSHSSKSYQDIGVKQRIIAEFATQISEIACALSTLHSNVSKKISIMFALFNNNVKHFYFFDIASVTGAANEQDTNVPMKQSEYILTILRKLNVSLKSGYDTHLVHLEEAIHLFLSAKIRYFQQQQSDEAINKQNTESTSDLSLIQQELTQHSNEIVEKFTDYVNYLNKLNPYISLCLNCWCKNLQEYNPSNNRLVKSIGLDASVQVKLADKEKRTQLCHKQEKLTHSVANCIRAIGQICDQVKLLLSKSLLNSNYLSVFNHLMHRINALEKSFDETKELFTSKLALEHDLGITVESDLLSVDDCILSSMVFFRNSIVNMRLMLEMHYFFFVDNSCSSNSGSQSTSPLVISGQLIPEEDNEEDDEEEEEDEEAEDDDEDSGDETSQQTGAAHIAATEPTKSAPIFKSAAPQAKLSPNPHASKSIQTESVATKSTPPHDKDEEIRQFEELLTKTHREMTQLKQEKEQWTIESELSQLKLEQEQRKVAELEMRLQSLLTQLTTQPPPRHNSVTNTTTWGINPHVPAPNSVQHQQSSLNRANSNTNSLTSSSGKSLDANNAELGSISSAASLQSPTLDCFGTVNYPSINDQSSVTLSEDNIFNEMTNVAANHRGNKPNGVSAEQQPPTEPVQNDYLQHKMAKLINTLQLTDSRAAVLQQECNAIRARYLQLIKEKAELESRMADQHHTLSTVQEEYQTSVENYEFQLRTMSEHLAELNEKLTAQREEIDLLKYQQQQQQQPSGKTSSGMAKAFRRKKS